MKLEVKDRSIKQQDYYMSNDLSFKIKVKRDFFLEFPVLGLQIALEVGH